MEMFPFRNTTKYVQIVECEKIFFNQTYKKAYFLSDR